MKKNFLVLLLFLPFLIGSCDKPSPVELSSGEQQPDDPIELIVLNQNPSEELNSTEPDSGFVFLPPPTFRFGAHIVVVKSTTKERDSVKRANLGQGVFYDLSSPINDDNGKLISYTTLPVQFIRFQNVTARESGHTVRYRNNRQVKDTMTGPKYILLRRPGALGDPFDFDLNSTITIDIKKFSVPMERFTIATPQEIKGDVELLTRNNGTKVLNLKWNTLNRGTVDIVLSGISVVSQRAVPLFRIRTIDDGKLIVPTSIMSAIPAGNFSKLAVSFLRQTESLADFHPGKIYFQIQSLDNKLIHLN